MDECLDSELSKNRPGILIPDTIETSVYEAYLNVPNL
jgi:hypothetical protein